MTEVIKSFCSRLCGGTCGILVHVDGGKITRVEGDPDAPFNKSFICPKGRALPELLYHPDRLKFPLKRIAKKGENRWQPISMDEALTAIAQNLQGCINEFGAESILLYAGAYRGLERNFIQRFASVLGTPNTVNTDNVCHAPRTMASTYTFGAWAIPDFDYPPKCIIVWGKNSFHTNGGGTPAQFHAASGKGTKFIVIDPRKIPFVSKADLWLKPRPGSDGLLALAMLHVIIHEELYDKDFVDRWTLGFEQLQERIAEYSPDNVAEKTWVSQSQIEQAARMFATTKPAVIQWGNALDQTSNAFQTCRAIAILKAITGNLDVAGGEVFLNSLPLMSDAEFSLIKDSLRAQKTPVGSQFPLAIQANIVASQEASRAILDEKPYPLKAALVFGSNPLLTYANATETYEAFKKLDFLVVAELFMTPTAALADIILPVAANLEYNDLMQHHGYIAARPQLKTPPGECLSDLQWMNQIAEYLGLGKYFWQDEIAAIDTILEPAGLSFEKLKKMGIQHAENHYRKYEQQGFRTPSAKVELFSQSLQEKGIDPLPNYSEPLQTPFGSPELIEEYPLVLTNSKSPFFFHASHRNLLTLRKLCPEPIVELNPETATRLRLKEGDLVYIETPRGKIKQRLRVNPDLDPRVVVVAHGWWFPERDSSDLYGWQEANLNLLTDSSPPHDPAMGAANLRGLICKVYKA